MASETSKSSSGQIYHIPESIIVPTLRPYEQISIVIDQAIKQGYKIDELPKDAAGIIRLQVYRGENPDFSGLLENFNRLDLMNSI